MPSSSRTSRRRALVVGVLALLALAGCGSTEDEDDTPTSELDAFLARIWGEGDPESAAARELAREESIAECMAQAGFDYVPEVTPASYTYSNPFPLTREYAQQYGYGETTEPEPGVVPRRWSIQMGATAAQRENMDYHLALTPQARDEYWATMDGSGAPDSQSPPEDLGCRGRAYQEAFEAATTPEAFAEVEEAVTKASLELQADPRLAEILLLWKDCMAGAGYPGLADFLGGVNVVTDLGNAFPAPGDMPYEEIATTYASELAEIRAAEIAVAVADASCLATHNYYEVWLEAKHDAEQQVVDTYRADLEAWAQWAEERRAEADG